MHGLRASWADSHEGGHVKLIPLDSNESAQMSVAKCHGAPENLVEDGLRVGGRTGNHAEDLARRRLLLERFGEIAIARLKLREQPHVLDRDDGLVGEGLEQANLLIGEKP